MLTESNVAELVGLINVRSKRTVPVIGIIGSCKPVPAWYNVANLIKEKYKYAVYADISLNKDTEPFEATHWVFLTKKDRFDLIRTLDGIYVINPEREIAISTWDDILLALGIGLPIAFHEGISQTCTEDLHALIRKEANYTTS